MKRFLLLLIFFIGFSQIGFCDPLVILHTSDVHGRLDSIEYRGIPSVGGAARRKTYFDNIKKENIPVLIVDSGDYYQGSIFYSVFRGEKSAKLLQYLPYDVMVFGNHEFDDGVAHLKKLVRISKAPYIATNLTFDDKYLSKNVPKYMLKEINGKKILILGVTTTKLDNLTNSTGVKVEDPVLAMKRVIAEVYADKIFVVSHCRLKEDERIAKEISQIDLILGGHNHYFFKYPKRIANTRIIQSGEFGVSTGRIDYDLEKGVQNFEQIYLTDNVVPDKFMQKRISRINNKISRIENNRICKLPAPILVENNKLEQEQTPFGHLLLDAMVDNVEDWDIAFQNSGSIRLKRDLQKEITQGDLIEILPFDNRIVSCKLQGEYLKQILDKGSIAGRSYLQYKSNRIEFEDDKFYNVITVDYLQNGKDGYKEFNKSTNCKQISSSQVRMLKKYLTKINKN